MRNAVRHQQIFVGAAERDEARRCESISNERAPVREREYARDETLAHDRIVESAALLHGEVRHRVDDLGGEYAATAAIRWQIRIAVDVDAVQTAARRVLHEDVAAHIGQRRNRPLRKLAQRIGHVDAGVARRRERAAPTHHRRGESARAARPCRSRVRDRCRAVRTDQPTPRDTAPNVCAHRRSAPPRRSNNR